MKQIIAGKVDKIEVKPYKDKEKQVDKQLIHFRLREWTSRKFPEGHQYAGKTVYDWYDCKAFNGIAENLIKQLKDNDYVVLEVRANRYVFDRKDVDVIVNIPGAGERKLKAVVPNFPGYEYIVDDYRLMEDVATTNGTAADAQTIDPSDEKLYAALAGMGTAVDTGANTQTETAGTDATTPTANTNTSNGAPF